MEKSGDLKPAMPDDALQALLRSVVESAFTPNWLNNKVGTNKVQLVWQRKDHLANIEIQALGSCIQVMNRVNSDWVRGCVKEARSGDYGKLYEVVCAAMFAAGRIELFPAPRKQKAYDVTLAVPGNRLRLLLSIKHHDMTIWEQEFRAECRKLRAVAREMLCRNDMSAQIAFVAQHKYLRAENWKAMQEFIRKGEFCTNYDKNSGMVNAIAPLKFGPDGMPLSQSPLSDVLIVLSQASVNDQKNFLEKFDKAGEGFMRAGIGFTPEAPRVVFMRVHPTALVRQIEGHAIRRLNSNEEIGLDGAILYQPAYLRRYDGSSIIGHHLRMVDSPRLKLSQLPFQLEVPFGEEQKGAPKNAIVLAGRQHIVEDHYFFQEGDLYSDLPPLVNGKAETNLRSFAAGILPHLVLPGGVILDVMAYPREEELLLV